ncbi:HK97 family phage prohead protease [Cognatishimia sp. SS12]|uniref:HK97 family phage prohead protease n=1 Tax=Cognatishimia sp. SS12 TaxID=2979465 RepID=UPI0023310F5E|nr:HK97 family phage prohead protease [Cognatishimia sp. SS12]MDC0737535.1 HK97 family phage prohead protease [Cognatishimia sp. SS12]
MELERKFAQADQVIALKDGCQISGYASLFGAVDQGGDIVEPGAYAASLARLMASGRRVKMLWQHDPAQPIGIWDEVREDSKGLWVCGRLLPDVARAREAAALITAGALDGLSIGYRTVKASKSAAGQRHLTELDLWEVSLVTFPMLASARVAAKAEAPEAELLQDIAALFQEARVSLAQPTPPEMRKDQP